MKTLEEALQMDEKFKNFSAEDLLTLLNERISTRIYAKLFPKIETKRDIEFLNKMRTLQWISPYNLYISFQDLNEDILKLSIQGIFLKNLIFKIKFRKNY